MQPWIVQAREKAYAEQSAVYDPQSAAAGDALGASRGPRYKEQFAKLCLEDGRICLVNKAYIVCVSHLTAQPGMESGWLPEAVEIGETPA